MKRILGVIVMVTLFSCSSEKRFVELFDKHPIKAAELCAENYPPILKYIKGDTIVNEYTIYRETDSVPCPEAKDEKGNAITPKVKCPDTEIIHKIITTVDTIQVLDSATVTAFQNAIKERDREILALKEKVADKSDKIGVWRWISIALIVVVLGMIALLILRK